MTAIGDSCRPFQGNRNTAPMMFAIRSEAATELELLGTAESEPEADIHSDLVHLRIDELFLSADKNCCRLATHMAFDRQLLN